MFRYSFFIFLFILLTLSIDSAWAASNDLLVAPTRVVFLDRERMKTVNVVNRGQTEATYRISFKNMGMNPEGGYHDITKPEAGERFADPFLRFSPRQVTLKPGQSQTVRLMLRRAANMELGEYRSHLVFTTVPPESTGQSVETNDSNALSVQLIPVVSVSIPVLIQLGPTDHQVKMRDVTLQRQDGKPKSIQLVLDRTGPVSSYGDLLVFAGSGAEAVIIGELRGVPVLYPYASRRVSVSLTLPPKTPTAGPFRVAYYQRQDEQRLTTVYDETTVK